MSTTIEPPVLGYPKTRSLILNLEIQIENPDKEEYIFSDPSIENSGLQLGFVADLFDLLNFEASLGVSRINNETPESIKQKL